MGWRIFGLNIAANPDMVEVVLLGFSAGLDDLRACDVSSRWLDLWSLDFVLKKSWFCDFICPILQFRCISPSIISSRNQNGNHNFHLIYSKFFQFWNFVLILISNFMSIFWIIIRITYKNYESLILPKNAHEIIPIFFDHTLHANCAATTLLLALKIENKGKINPKKNKKQRES